MATMRSCSRVRSRSRSREATVRNGSFLDTEARRHGESKRSFLRVSVSLCPVLFLCLPLHAETFLRDVAPILNKAGCTSGPCHGAAKGKNGFKLSLRGYDPQFDYEALLYDLSGRRFN